MTARLYFNTSATSNTYVEVDARMRLLDWEVREQAEEGSAAMSTVVFDDPDMDWDVTPWRGWYMVEDASTGSNSVICGGWIADQEIGREGGDRENPLARVWTVSLADANAYWQMRVMVGADANRPAETDVERMQWLLATNEVAWAYDTTTYVQTTTPVDMDACDYRGQYLPQIMDDCAQSSGRNWFTWIDLVGGVRKVMVWYGHDDWAVYDSPLSLTNDPADFVESALVDGTSLVWLISPDTKLRRDPSRMYDGVYLQYDGGAVYRDLDPRTVRRDFVSPSYNVKSSTKAIARAVRYLAELDEQDEVISTSVELPAAKATMLRAGMRVPFRATHLPGYDVADTYYWMRVLSCSITPIAAGERYRLTLELAPTGDTVVALYEGDVFAGIIRSEGNTHLGYGFDQETGAPGWDTQAVVGPISVDQTSAPFTSMTVSAAMVVRIWAHATLSGVVDAGVEHWVAVCVNGIEIGRHTLYSTGGYWGPIFDVDVRDYTLQPGDVVSVTSVTSAGWTSSGANDSWLRVGRGTFVWAMSSFTGP